VSVRAEHPARLLIVDDELVQLHALCQTLELEGYATRGFHSAQQALAELKPGEVDLLLTDLMMPEMDGIALIDAARRIDSSLGAIIMTGHGTIDTAVQALQGGALDYILKPFKLDAMLPVISRTLAVQRLRRENAQLQERERRLSEELVAAYQTLESFSYSISHDLRSPLRAIEGFAQILLDDFGPRLDDGGQEVVNIIHDGCRKLDQLIVGLLAFSQSGRHPLQVVHIDMTAMAKEAAAEVLVGYNGPQPRIDVEKLPDCSGDATLIRQVWSNLIGNAIKYSSKRTHPQVAIGGAIGQHERLYRVQDNGAGFDMHYAHKLFAVFQRLHGPQEFPGTGVGLAIVQRILTRHGGRVWAEGTPEVGACFHFSFPIVTECAPGHTMSDGGAI
jgi:two-component system sensor histidine kinase/response regulator